MNVSSSSATRARISSVRNDGSFVRVLASAACRAARESDSDRTARLCLYMCEPLPQCDHEAGRPMLNWFQAWDRDRDVSCLDGQFGPDGVLKADVELRVGASCHLGHDR